MRTTFITEIKQKTNDNDNNKNSLGSSGHLDFGWMQSEQNGETTLYPTPLPPKKG